MSIVFFLFTFIHFCLSAAQQEAILNLDGNQAEMHAQIAQLAPAPFLLKKLTFQSDTHFSEQEFLYLIDLHEGEQIAATDLYKALYFLQKKQKFETATFSLRELNDGYHLHVDLKSFWTLKNVKFHGILIGRDAYRTHYLIEPGERFDEEKHELSLKKFVDAFKSEGYFKGSVERELERNQKTKEVTVHINLHRGWRFSIRQVGIFLHEGNPGLEYELTRFLQKRLKGSFYAKETINRETKALKRFLAKKGFLHAAIMLDEKLDKKKGRVDLTFTIELQQKKAFIFTGNRFFSQDTLLDLVLQFGSSTWLLPASMLSEELMHAYHQKGFWQVRIDAREEDEQYVFEIDEGKRAVVAGVELNGVKNLNANYLIKKYFSDFTGLTYFDGKALQRSIDKLIDMYHARGFLEAQVLKKQVISKDGVRYVARITIQEGQQSYLRSSSIKQFPDLWNYGPFLKLRVRKELVPFTSDVVQEQRQWLMQHFHKQGYVRVDLKSLMQREGSEIDVVWEVNLDEQPARFGATVIQGSGLFPFKNVMRELRYKKGQLWHRDALKQSFIKLKELEIFDSVQLYPDRLTHDEPEQTILLKLKHDDPFEVRLRAGFALKHVTKRLSIAGVTYRAGGSFLIKNPLNAGDQLLVDLDFTRVHRDVALKYRRPWLLGLPIKTLIMGYSNTYDYPGFVGSQRSLYRITQQGFLLGLRGKRRYFDAGMNLGIEWMKTEILDASARQCVERISEAINVALPLVNQYVPYFLAEPVLVIDVLDNKLNPTSGSLSVVSIKAMVPVKKGRISSYFVKLLAEQSFFIPFKRIVTAVRIRFGHIFHKVFNEVMPNERFYLGGANSIRAYENDFAPPLGCFVDEDGCKQFVAQGGKSMFNANFEIRFPVYKQVGAVLFQDIGALSSTAVRAITACDVLAATGFGVRYHTPIGPLRFDLGFKWDRAKQNGVENITRARRIFEKFAWFLSFGQAF